MEFGVSQKQAEDAVGEVRLILPYPISANRYWRKTKEGKVYVSPEAKQYRQDVKNLVSRAGSKPLEGPICLTLHLYRPQRSGDLMNREKVLSDALQGIIFLDDAQIEEAHLYLHDDKFRPRVELCLKPLFDVK